jgi:hypothetical protein
MQLSKTAFFLLILIQHVIETDLQEFESYRTSGFAWDGIKFIKALRQFSVGGFLIW